MSRPVPAHTPTSAPSRPPGGALAGRVRHGARRALLAATSGLLAVTVLGAAPAVPRSRKGGPRPVPERKAHFAHLTLDALRGYRAALGEEEGRVSYWRRILQARLDLLRAGGTLRHKELLAPFGLDATDPAFWDKGLSLIASMIDELEAMEEGA